VDQLNSHFDIWYSPEELAIAHQIRMEIKRGKGLKKPVDNFQKSHHLGVMTDDLMMTSNDDFLSESHHKVIKVMTFVSD
jgi:hypothetical protein